MQRKCAVLSAGSLVLAGVCVCAIDSAYSQDADEIAGPLKSVRMVRTSTPPVLDGILDDEVWSQAAVVDDFHQSQPIEGLEPTERTEVYLLYDDDFIYIGGKFWDSEPDRIAAGTLRHRALRLGDDDRIAIVLSPYNDRRSGYKFETNANAVKNESIYQNVNQSLPDWDTIWYTASSRNDEGWATEIAIPFKSISLNAASDTWGINFSRAVRRKGEEITWVSRNRQYNPSVVGEAVGFENLDQGLGLDVVPSFALNQRRTFDPSISTSDNRPSLNVFYRITPSLNGALTLNTDFSATAVDTRQVNLTRFSLFFPEQRAFFLQDTDIFEFGRIGGRLSGNDINTATSRTSRENGRPFFSRRLGLSSSGQPVDIDYGGKISGRIGRWSVGGLAVQQDDFGDVDGSRVLAARASASILEESAVGVIATHGDPNSNLDNSLIGVDFRYLNTRLPGGRVLEADAWFQQSETTNLDGEDQAYGFGLRSPNRSGLRWGYAYREIQENFNPALGFVNRSNISDQTAELGYRHFIEDSPIVSMYFGADVQRIESLDGGVQSQVLALRPLEISNRSRDDLTVRYFSTDEILSRPFEIYSDPSDPANQVVIPIGSYSFDEYRIELSTGSQRNLAGTVAYQSGDFYDGERTNIFGEIVWRPTMHFTFKLAYDWNEIMLPHGEFETRLVQLTTEVPFSSNLSWVNLIQYDNVSESMGINSRLHWVLQDGREAFVVLTHNLQDLDRDNSFESTLSDLAVKVNYTFRY